MTAAVRPVSGAPPAGPAGGDLVGSTYPNPVIAAGKVTIPDLAFDPATQAELDALSSSVVHLAGAETVTGAKTFTGTTIVPVPAPGTQQAANAVYVEGLIAAVSVRGLKDPVRLATTTALPAHTRSGIVLTASANGALAVDGVAPSVGDSLLYKDGAGISSGVQVGHIENGLYTVTAPGSAGTPWVLTRRVDADVTGDLVTGTVVRVTEGTANAGTSWTLSTVGTITIGTTAQVWGPLNSGGIRTTVQPNEGRTLLHADLINESDGLDNPWQIHASGSFFGAFYDSVIGFGVNVSRAAPGLIWFDQWEQGYHPGGDPNTWWGERFSVFRSHSGNVETRLGVGCVFQEQTVGGTGSGGAETFNLAYGINCTSFSVSSVANAIGTFTPAGQDWATTFDVGGVSHTPGSGGPNPAYYFRGKVGQVNNSEPTTFYVGHGDYSPGDFPGLAFQVATPNAASLNLHNVGVVRLSLAGASADQAKVQLNTNANLGAVLDILQPPAGNGGMSGLTLREAGSPDAVLLNVTKSTGAGILQVGSVSDLGVYVGTNLGVGAFSYGGALGVINLATTTAPTSSPSSGHILYTDPITGALMARSAAGNVYTLAGP